MAVTFAAAQSYTFQTTLATTSTYPLMNLLDGAKATLMVSDNFFEYGMPVFSLCAKMIFTATESGTYYVLVADAHS
jgi:hypothetical protein